MFNLKNAISNIFSSTVLLYVGIVLLAYLVSMSLLSKNRITMNTVKRAAVHKELLGKASWDYVSSILWIEYMEKDRENTIISDNISKAIENRYRGKLDSLRFDFDSSIKGTTSDISTIIRETIRPYGDKLVMFRYGDKLVMLDDMTKGSNISIYKDDDMSIRSDISNDILLNSSPNFKDFQRYVYSGDGKELNNFDIDELQKTFVDGTYDIGNLKGMMLCASYIDWKKGLFGDNISLSSGEMNPEVRQLIIVSKIDIVETLTRNPLIVKHMSNFNRNAKVVDQTFDSDDRYNLIVLIVSFLMTVVVGITILVQWDLANIRKESARKRRATDRVFEVERSGNELRQTKTKRR